ncbi:MAG: hypothetical protein K6B46_05880 [Opitutales bacterium]|nr:hypothetical protein [Opitutales bacterium]
MMKNIFAILSLALAGTLFCACVAREGADADTRARNAAKTKQQRQMENLEKMIVVRISEDSKFCIGLDDRNVLTAPKFSSQIATLGKTRPGTPVLIYVTEDFLKEHRPLVDFARRECRRAKLGKIYFEIPENLD